MRPFRRYYVLFRDDKVSNSATSWVKKSRQGKKLQFSCIQLLISDKGDYGCSKFQLCRHVPSK